MNASPGRLRCHPPARRDSCHPALAVSSSYTNNKQSRLRPIPSPQQLPGSAFWHPSSFLPASQAKPLVRHAPWQRRCTPCGQSPPPQINSQPPPLHALTCSTDCIVKDCSSPQALALRPTHRLPWQPMAGVTQQAAALPTSLTRQGLVLSSCMALPLPTTSCPLVIGQDKQHKC